MPTTATLPQAISVIQALNPEGLSLSLLAQAAEFERLYPAKSYSVTLLRRAAETINRLERERASLATDFDAVCLARDAAGILGPPAEAITMLDEENKRLVAELGALNQGREGEPA